MIEDKELDRIYIPLNEYGVTQISDPDNKHNLVFALKDAHDVSDGWHTFGELYTYRMLYNAALFNQWAQIYDSKIDGRLHDVHKSWKHSDGKPCFGGGWFVVVAQLPTGQITNHYKAEHWDLFKIPARDTAAEYDGHTPDDVAKRLMEFLYV